jgi:hypothetical protein
MMSNNDHGLGNLDDLFQDARADGLTDETLDLVVANLDGPTMLAPVGVALDRLGHNEVTLAMNVIDMSGSMAPHRAAVIDAYNDDYRAAMLASGAADDVLVSSLLFNDSLALLHGFLCLPDTPPLTPSTYHPEGRTALHDALAAALTNVVLYAQQLRQSGIAVHCLVILYSDGNDNASTQSAASVRRAALELARQEIYTLAYAGFRSGGSDENSLRRLADTIGFTHILPAGLDGAELRRIFRMVSFSTVGVSRGRAGGLFT